MFVLRASTRFPASSPFRRFILLVLALATLAAPVPIAIAADNPSGLAVPRFVTTRSTPINVRVGPGTKYAVAWVFVKAGLPVEIIQEFDTWRKIRDVDGQEGWVHQNLLSSNRAGYVDAGPGKRVALRAGRSEESGVRAWLTSGFEVQIAGCDGTWCEVSATDHANGSRGRTYSGYLPQGLLWGVYPDEVLD